MADQMMKLTEPNEIEMLARAIAHLVSESFDLDRNDFYVFVGKLQTLLEGFDRFRGDQVKEMHKQILEHTLTHISPIFIPKTPRVPSRVRSRILASTVHLGINREVRFTMSMSNPTPETRCDFCEKSLPAGCRHFSAKYSECPLNPRTDAPWIVGLAVWEDLMDRRGIKSELAACDVDIQVEIVEAIGSIALQQIARLK